MAVDSITKARAKLTIEVNGLHLAPTDVPESLRRFVRPLSFLNRDTDFELSFSGTCLLFRHRGSNLLLCTRHQLTNAARRPDEIVLVVDKAGGGSVGINPDEVSQAVLDPAEDPTLANVADVMIAEYSSARPERDVASGFLRFDVAAAPDLRSVSSEDVSAVFAIGYPLIDTSYDARFDEDWNVTGVDIVSRWVRFYLRPVERTGWDVVGLMPLGPASDDDPVLADPDGISGAPVFFIHGIKAGRPALGFAGMIVRADRRGRVNVVEAAHIRQILEARKPATLASEACG